MTSTRGIHHRRSIRLQGYDYSQNGAYFVTICTQNRECLFGDIITVGAGPCACPVLTPRGCPVPIPDDPPMMVLNDAGHTVQAVWEEIPMHYTGIGIDEFVAMPNHIHGILVIGAVVGATPRGCPDRSAYGNGEIPHGPTPINGQKGGQAQGPAPTAHIAPLSLGDIVHRFKTMTTKRYTDGVKQSGWRSFAGRLWQRNYWEHVIRNEMELNRIREYVRNNPAQWEDDRLNAYGGDPRGRPSLPVVREPVVSYTAEGWMV